MTNEPTKEAAREYAHLRFEFGDLDYDHEELLRKHGREAVLRKLYSDALHLDRNTLNSINLSYSLAR